MNKKIRFVLINVITVFLLLLFIEIVSRIVVHQIYNRDFDSSLIVEYKYLTSSGLRENREGLVWGKKFHTDANGGRKNKQAYDKKKLNWLYIGDSVTEGVGVDDSSTFSSLNADAFTEYNICNYSLIGYSTSDYVNVLQSTLLQDSTVDLVTLFFCLNDVYGKSGQKDLPVMAKQNWMGKLNAVMQDNCAAYKLAKLFFYKSTNRYFTYDLQFYKNEDQRFQQAMSDLRFCDSLCQTQDIYFNVVMLPYQSQLRDKNFAPQNLVRDFCEADLIDFSDASEYLLQQPDPSSLYLFADEIHFSDKGHKAIADFLSQ